MFVPAHRRLQTPVRSAFAATSVFWALVLANFVSMCPKVSLENMDTICTYMEMVETWLRFVGGFICGGVMLISLLTFFASGSLPSGDDQEKV